jgi:DNA-binding transcriptional MerR regulator
MDAPDTSTASRRPVKSEAAFRTISEVSEDLDVPQHVLRFWESKFAQIKPLKRGGGRRYYRPEDVALLGHIRDLLYRDGYTIRGVQKLLREPGARNRIEAGETEAAPSAQPLEAEAEAPEEIAPGGGEVLREVLDEILELRRLLADARRK